MKIVVHRSQFSWTRLSFPMRSSDHRTMTGAIPRKKDAYAWRRYGERGSAILYWVWGEYNTVTGRHLCRPLKIFCRPVLRKLWYWANVSGVSKKLQNESQKANTCVMGVQT